MIAWLLGRSSAPTSSTPSDHHLLTTSTSSSSSSKSVSPSLAEQAPEHEETSVSTTTSWNEDFSAVFSSSSSPSHNNASVTAATTTATASTTVRQPQPRSPSEPHVYRRRHRSNSANSCGSGSDFERLWPLEGAVSNDSQIVVVVAKASLVEHTDAVLSKRQQPQRVIAPRSLSESPQRSIHPRNQRFSNRRNSSWHDNENENGNDDSDSDFLTRNSHTHHTHHTPKRSHRRSSRQKTATANMRQRGYLASDYSGSSAGLTSSHHTATHSVSAAAASTPHHQNTSTSSGHSHSSAAVYNNGSQQHVLPAVPLIVMDDADIAAGRIPKAMSQQQFQSPHQSQQKNKNYSQSHPDLSHTTSLHSHATTTSLSSIDTAPNSLCTINSTHHGHTDLDFFEDLITEPVLVLGVDISHLTAGAQFGVCAAGLFAFSLLYGYLQELLSVTLCSRQLGLFLATVQFCGYTVLAYFLRTFVYQKQQQQQQQQLQLKGRHSGSSNTSNTGNGCNSLFRTPKHVPLALYLGLSLLRAVDLAMTNLAMQYINYPAKTLMKSSRVVFTMIFGVLIQRKVYKTVDYAIVLAMVLGLAMFMHADANSSAVFHHMGVIMLTVSLVCDGAISNMSETIMSQFGVGQDEFIFRLYSISLIAISAAASVKGDMRTGMNWMLQPGTYQEYLDNVPLEERSWSVGGKIAVLLLFSTMGFFGSSCSAAITKNFGALTMSITSTARKATTLFLSFFLFNNVCTAEHLAGIVVFITALTTKSLRRRNSSKSNRKKTDRANSSKRRSRRPRDFNSGGPLEVAMPDGLTLRHRSSSRDGLDVMSGGGASTASSRRDLVHIV